MISLGLISLAGRCGTETDTSIINHSTLPSDDCQQLTNRAPSSWPARRKMAKSLALGMERASASTVCQRSIGGVWRHQSAPVLIPPFLLSESWYGSYGDFRWGL